MRRVIAAVVVVGLAVGVFLLWPRDEDEPPDTQAIATTTTTRATSPTTASPGTTSSSVAETHVVETVEEAEQVLRELWFGWFEGIYNQDEERIREVVGNPDQIEAAVELFGEMEFNAPPTADAIQISDVELLRSDADCLAVWAAVDATAVIGESNEGVHVFLSREGEWLFISQWPFREDLWEGDCESRL